MIAEDFRWMDYALRLGHRALGTTADNPAVGCVIVKDGRVLGVGCTQPGGRPHAEPQALAMAGAAAKGATAYVSLEPCSHHGRSPPCANALVASGIARCVVAATDPDPRVSGRGIEILREAGIEVQTECRAIEARAAHAGFFSRIVKNRPYVTLKLALSADGKIAAGGGQRTQITGPETKARVHLMRSQYDAILVGMGTVRIDDPELTVRLPGMEMRSPKPFVLGRGPLPQESHLARRGAEVLSTLDLTALAVQGINRLMVEGGAQTARAFLEAELVDELQLFQSPLKLGPEGVDAFAGLSLVEVLAAFHQTHEEMLGNDRLRVYVKRQSAS